MEGDQPRKLEPILRSGALFVPQQQVHVVRPRDGWRHQAAAERASSCGGKASKQCATIIGGHDAILPKAFLEAFLVVQQPKIARSAVEHQERLREEETGTAG